MKTVSTTGALIWATGAVALSAGCGQVLGLDEFTDQVSTSGQGGETGATTTSATGGGSSATGGGGGASAATTAATTGTGGSGGMGAGTGGSGGSFCVPGATDPCYTGPAGTEDVGMCIGGTHVCNDQGTAYLPGCVGEVLPAATDDCDAIGDEDCDGVACSEPIWAKSFASSNEVHVAAGLLGETTVYGTFTSSLLIGNTNLITAGSDDLYLTRLDATGNPFWAKQFGDSSKQYAGDVAVSATGNIVITSPLNGSVNFGGASLVSAGNYDVAVAMFDASGNHLWSKRFGDGTHQYPKGVAIDSVGDVVVVGEFQGAIDFGTGSLVSAGSNDIFIAKLSGASGATLWAKRFGDSASQTANAVGFDSAGNIAVTGTYSGTLNLGQTNLVSASTDVYLGRFDAQGNHACSKSATSAGGAGVDALAISSTGNIVLSGGFSGSTTIGGASWTSAGGGDLYVASYSPTCLYQWSNAWGGSSNEFSTALAVDGADSILLAALSFGGFDFGGPMLTSAGAYDLAVAKLTSQGAHTWSRMFGSTGLDASPAISAGGGNEIAIGFAASGTFDVGTGPLPGGIGLARFAP